MLFLNVISSFVDAFAEAFETIIHGFYGMKSLVLKYCQHVFRNILGQLAEAAPQAVTVTREEREAIERVRFPSFQCNQSRLADSLVPLHTVYPIFPGQLSLFE